MEIQKTSLDSDQKTQVDKEEYDYPYPSTTRSGYGSVPSDQPHERHSDTRMSTVELYAPSPGHGPIISGGVDPPFEPPYRSESPQNDIDSSSSQGSSVYEEPLQDQLNFPNTIPMKKLQDGTKFMEQI